jgi:hypothetical protein
MNIQINKRFFLIEELMRNLKLEHEKEISDIHIRMDELE